MADAMEITPNEGMPALPPSSASLQLYMCLAKEMAKIGRLQAQG